MRLTGDIIRLPAASYWKMVQNLGWAASYTSWRSGSPLALAWPGFTLPPPAVGAVLMSLSTIVVALNAQLLRRTDLAVGRRRSSRT